MTQVSKELANLSDADSIAKVTTYKPPMSRPSKSKDINALVAKYNNIPNEPFVKELENVTFKGKYSAPVSKKG